MTGCYNTELKARLDTLAEEIGRLRENDLEGLRSIAVSIAELKKQDGIPKECFDLLSVAENTIIGIDNKELSFELGLVFLNDGAARMKKCIESGIVTPGAVKISPEDVAELDAQVEVLAGVVADIDEENKHAMRVVGDLIEKVRNIAGLPGSVLPATRDASNAVAGILSGELTFDEGYPMLCDAVERIRIAVDNIEFEDGAETGMTPEDIQDFETQLEVLSDLVDVVSEGSDHVLDVIADLFGKIRNIPTRTLEIGSAAGDGEAAVKDIRNGASGFEDGMVNVREAFDRLNAILSSIKPETEMDSETEFEIKSVSEDKDAILSDFAEQQGLLCDALETMILDYEKGDSCAMEDIIRNFRSLEAECLALELGDIEKFIGEAAFLLESSSGDFDRDIVTGLLSAKDYLAEYFSAIAEGADHRTNESLEREILAKIKRGIKTERRAERPVVAPSKPKPAPATHVKPKSKKVVPKFEIKAGKEELAEFAAETSEYLNTAEMALLALEKDPDNRSLLDEIFRGFHNIKGISGFLNLKDMQQLSHDAEWLLNDAREGKLKFTSACAEVSLQAVDMLKEMADRVKRTQSGEKYETPAGYISLLEKFEERCFDEVTNEESEEKTKLETGDAEEIEAVAEEQAVECEPSEAKVPVAGKKGTGEKARIDGFVKVGTARLDSLIDAVGELVIANAMVTQEPEIQKTSNARLARNVAQLGKITRELQELAMSMRMVSLKSTFQRMARVARDLAVKSGIPIEFTFSGEETELDRNVVEEISSPLVHMVRNAVDHGIEDANERLRLGKPAKGQIHLSSCHEGGNVLIRLKDDGKGLDKEAILAKAEKMGFVKPGDELTDRDINYLIFKPGFTTADEVTDVSGRGVGMDVVRKNIENLRGRIEIESEKGKGTTFTIRIPLTLAIIDGMIVTVGCDRFVIPTISIIESMRPEPGQIKTVVKKGEMLDVRGDLMPLFRLYSLFNLSGAKEDPTEALAVIVGDNGKRCAILVDDLVGQQQVVIKTLGKTFGNLEGVSGGAIMGDGRVALILDTNGLINLASTV